MIAFSACFVLIGFAACATPYFSGVEQLVLFDVRYQRAVVRRIIARLFRTITLTRHAGAAHAPGFFIPSAIWMVLTHPADTEADGTVLVHVRHLGIPKGPELSSFRSSCSASAQHSSSFPGGQPKRSQILYARAFISCSVGSAMDASSHRKVKPCGNG
jgi:hypothetical protein